MNPPPAWAPLIPLLWIIAWVGASLVYRRMRGKPLIYAKLQGTKYRQTNASGHSHKSWITRLGGARGVLVVQVTADELDIHPFPPFNWFFLPEIYALEYRVPWSSVGAAATPVVAPARRSTGRVPAAPDPNAGRGARRRLGH